MKPLNLLPYALLIVTLTGLAGCVITPTPSSSPTPATYNDPFAYCKAVGTIDTPGPQYTGPKVPQSIAQGLQTAMNAPNVPINVLENGSFWRCVNGNVYACFVGANLPCDEKANTDRTPTQAEKDFCTQNPNSDFIPAVVTGHNTVYEWICKDGQPEIARQIAQVDQQGFLANIWYEIKPQ